MQASEALTLLIDSADKELGRNSSIRTETPELSEHEEQLQIAVAIGQNMLNMMIPVARFRAHVTVESLGSQSRLGLGDFTVCGVDISSIKNGLIGLSMEQVNVHATLWEQRATGADMLNGYQGLTKTLGFRNWVKSLDAFETSATAH